MVVFVGVLVEPVVVVVTVGVAVAALVVVPIALGIVGLGVVVAVVLENVELKATAVAVGRDSSFAVKVLLCADNTLLCTDNMLLCADNMLLCTFNWDCNSAMVASASRRLTPLRKRSVPLLDSMNNPVVLEKISASVAACARDTKTANARLATKQTVAELRFIYKKV